MSIMDKIEISEKIIYALGLAIIATLVYMMRVSDIDSKKAYQVSGLLFIPFMVSVIFYGIETHKLDDYRQDFIVEKIFAEKEVNEVTTVEEDEDLAKDSDSIEYKVKSKDALSYVEVDYGMKDDGSFDYYIKDTYQRGGK